MNREVHVRFCERVRVTYIVTLALLDFSYQSLLLQLPKRFLANVDFVNCYAFVKSFKLEKTNNYATIVQFLTYRLEKNS